MSRGRPRNESGEKEAESSSEVRRCMWWQAFVLVCPDEALALVLANPYRRLLPHKSRCTVHRANFQPTITGIANIDFRTSRKNAD